MKDNHAVDSVKIAFKESSTNMRGKGVAVVLDVAEYEAMQEKIELLDELQIQIIGGR